MKGVACIRDPKGQPWAVRAGVNPRIPARWLPELGWGSQVTGDGRRCPFRSGDARR